MRPPTRRYFPAVIEGCCCPCLLGYQVADKIGENAILHLLLGCPCWAFIGGILLRIQYRPKNEIPENMVGDIICGLCCTPCVYCQMFNDHEERHGGGGEAESK